MDAVLSIVIERVANLATDEVKLLCGAKESANQLLLKLDTIQPCLHDAEMKAMTDPRIRGWLTRLKAALYEADDAIDEWNTKSQQLLAHDDTCWNAVSDFFTQLALRHNIGKKIEGINNDLTDIAKTVKNFSFLKNPATERGNESALISYDAILKARMTNSSKENVIGREEEIKSLREMLVGETYSEKSEIIVLSLVGSPGHGKTSLAKHMFHEVKNYFVQPIWVYAPDILDEQTVIDKMLDAVPIDTGSVKDLEGLKNILVDKFLKNKRLLLVIDDIWNVDREIWRRLCNIFNNFVMKGSRILVTTRHKNVAQDICSAHTIPIGPLSPEISLSILRNNVVLEGKDESEVSDLMEIGEKIVGKCGGVPLAITSIAGALRSKNTREGWERVLQSAMWQWQPNSVGGIFPALWLSYYHLPPQLKQCFRYCALYPKGSKIVKEDVVPMWVAHGYISEERDREMEDIGSEYFDELVGRSLFQNAEWDEYYNIKRCGMHDLVCDLAQFVANCDVLVGNEFKNTEFPPLHCRIDVDSFDKSYVNAMHGVKNLRTLLSTIGKRGTSCNLVKQFRCLRVLEWKFSKKSYYWDKTYATFPQAFCNLVHLRYLSLSGTSVQVLPNSIGQLWNLQYLDLRRTEIKKLPESIKNLSNLRYLDLSCTHISLLPSSITKLSNLRHLSLEASEISEIPEAVGSLNLLRSLNLGWTKISKLPESIASLSHLRELLVDNCGELSRLPSGICQLTSLKKLGIEGVRLRELPEGIGRYNYLQSLDKFVVVRKDDAEGSSNLQQLEQINNIRGTLSIENLEDAGSEEEAVTAHLELKRYLTKISLIYTTPNQSTTCDVVLQALRPHFDLNELCITGYPGCKLPSWLGFSAFSGLHELSLHGCIGCTTLPALGNLPELRTIVINGMPRVRRLTADLFGSMRGFPKLEFLSFKSMEEWEEWEPLADRGKGNSNVVAAVDDEDDGGGILGEERVFTFPSLRRFSISYCPKLRSLPPIFGASLQDVDIGWGMDFTNLEWCFPINNVESLSCCSAEWLNRLPSLPNLQSLMIYDDHVASELSNSLLKFSSLKTLMIKQCQNLKSLPEEMGSLVQLQKLAIYLCPLLEQSWDEGGEQWHQIKHITQFPVRKIAVHCVFPESIFRDWVSSIRP